MPRLSVYHGPGAWGLVSISPFCLKLDAFLRMTGIAHEAIFPKVPTGAPKGKVPWIEHDGIRMGDSTLIINYLQDVYGVNPDAGLTKEQQGESLAIQRLVENNLYWVIVYDRWVRPENWSKYKSTVFAKFSALPRALIAPLVRRKMKQQLKAQGMGLHTEDEIRAIGERDIVALAAMLGQKSFFHGEVPTNVDACVYSMLANIYCVDLMSPLKASIEGQAELVGFINRFAGRFYSSASSNVKVG